MMLIGVIWAAFAPLSLAALILIARWALGRAGAPRPWLIAAALVLAPVLAIYAWDRRQFAAACEEAGPPRIMRTAQADGIYLNSQTANSFGTRYVDGEGFAWIERADIYRRDQYVRVAKGENGALTEEKIPAVTARYEVREENPTIRGHHMQITRVIDRENGEELARAAEGYFIGGRMAMVLGAWGSASCLSAMTAPDTFAQYYHLARDTLRPAR